MEDLNSLRMKKQMLLIELSAVEQKISTLELIPDYLKALQKEPEVFYVIYKGPHTGVHIDWKLVESYCKTDKKCIGYSFEETQPDPSVYDEENVFKNDENLVVSENEAVLEIFYCVSTKEISIDIADVSGQVYLPLITKSEIRQKLEKIPIDIRKKITFAHIGAIKILIKAQFRNGIDSPFKMALETQSDPSIYGEENVFKNDENLVVSENEAGFSADLMVHQDILDKINKLNLNLDKTKVFKIQNSLTKAVQKAFRRKNEIFYCVSTKEISIDIADVSEDSNHAETSATASRRKRPTKTQRASSRSVKNTSSLKAAKQIETVSVLYCCGEGENSSKKL
ncbi:hypothetical protein Ccrd_023030, partial [Cynara cardunculus var. scolymus]